MVKEIKSKELRKALNDAGLGAVLLCKDCTNGYFFIASDDSETADKIAGIYENAIYCCHFKQQGVAEWVNDIKQLLNN